MASPANNSTWTDFIRGMPSPSAILEASFTSNSQPLDQVPFPSMGELTEAQDWLASPDGTSMPDGGRRQSSHNASSSVFNDPFSSPRRSSQLYVMRSEYRKEIRGIKERLGKCEEILRDMQTTLQTITNNHRQLAIWTTDMNGALSNLAQRFAEKMGMLVPVEEEWHMPEEEEPEH